MTRSITYRVKVLFIASALLLTALCGGLWVSSPSVSAARTVLGDINADGTMSTTDVRAYLTAIINQPELTDEQKAVGDVNGDGQYSTSDCRLMLDYILNGMPEAVDEEPIRSIWIPYMEVESLLSSGNVATAQNAIDACLDDCVSRGANTVYFHVRANSDAYYNSSVFNPTSRTSALLNKGFDPFAYAVTQAHAKGLKIEAWVNPYRIGADSSRAKTDAIFQYSGRYYYVPSDADVQALIVRGIKELVDNYDIDGVQFDDYFYPEGSVSATALADFETADYNAYKNGGGTLGIADWRRSVVNNLISAVYKTCHARSGCVFGISPACDFRANYNDMYVDAETWAKTPGYVDYLAPQLYVGFDHAYMPYDEILADWDSLTRHSGLKMVAGLALYKTGLLDDTWAGAAGRTEWLNNNTIMTRQINLADQFNWNGIALYSHQSFEVDSTRDASVAAVEIAGACRTWVNFGKDEPAQTASAVRGFWVPYMEVETMLASGNATTARNAINACLNDCLAKGANTVYFHVRANSDAYYKSSYYDANPKAKSLINSGFDPLAVAIELAHAKGLKIEAWVNPYRIGADSSRAKTDAIFQYSGRYYYVPSDADVQKLVVNGVRELVYNYDIDGVQFDDYFYPEGSVSSTEAASFESADYTAYKNSGGKLGVADWRRSVVNNLVATCYQVCHERTGCVFGISPSCDFERNYDEMYADAAAWAKTPGYVDYLAPQLYVGFNHAATPFNTILARWDALERHSGVQMIAGLALYKTGLLDDTWAGTNGRTEWLNNNNIMSRQIKQTYSIGWSGVAFYSHQSFTVGSDRNATVANADMASGCKDWLIFQ